LPENSVKAVQRQKLSKGKKKAIQRQKKGYSKAKKRLFKGEASPI
jgi:hypothetical protein